MNYHLQKRLFKLENKASSRPIFPRPGALENHLNFPIQNTMRIFNCLDRIELPSLLYSSVKNQLSFDVFTISGEHFMVIHIIGHYYAN